MELNDIQLEAIFTAMQGGTPMMESIVNMELDIKPPEARRQLVQKYTREEFSKVMREHVAPAMTPGRRAKMMLMRVISGNEDSVDEIKSSIQAYLDSL